MAQSKSNLQGNELGALLRRWRAVRNKSQIALSLDAGVSQRHLSFIEIGRSSPSRATLLGLADALDVPFRDRNVLLLAAGYAPIYPAAGWDDADMRRVTEALQRLLRQHEPFPAFVMDRYWNVVLTNAAAPRFFGSFVNLSARPTPRNLLHLMFDPQGMQPFIANWQDVARSLIQRVYREAVGRVVDAKAQELVSSLLAYPGAQSQWRAGPAGDGASDLPVIPITFVKDGEQLGYFSMLTTVAAPQAIATQELRVESMFPVDEQTEIRHRQIMDQPGSSSSH
ncbi:MAG: helix-turn-helix transcriptional regulator [Gammaproteobacteria bacterium]|nr:helix-turn-helix transcriptional regulator [Gammaproteobacteria bacterium]